MKASLNSYFDPWSNQHHGLKNFKVIPRYQQAAAVIFTALAGAVSFGILAMPVFRLLTNSSVPTQTMAAKVGKVWDKAMHQKLVDTHDSKGRTSLHKAVFKKDPALIQSLIKEGADINKKDHKGYTPLAYAMMGKKREIFIFFLNNGGDVNCKDHFGLSLLGLAIERGQLEFVEILLKNGADTENCDSNGTSALHLARRKGNAQAARLIEARAWAQGRKRRR